MKALVLKEKGNLEIVDKVRYDDPDKITIKVRAMGICGSDISSYKGLNPLVKYPIVVGHEIAGEVVSAPQNKSNINKGDRVVLEPYKYCGDCYPCSLGKTNCCENLEVIGVHCDGGMSEYFSHDSHLVHKVSDNVPWEYLPMVEPLTIAWQGITRAGLKKGEYVAITGAGTIGLLVALLSLSRGAIPIIIDPLTKRLEIAKSLGVEHTLDPKQQDVVEKIKEITDDRMAEVVIEASGFPQAVRDSIDYVSFAGRISLVGYPKNEISLPTFMITKKELDVKGSRNSLQAFPHAIELLENEEIDISKVISNIVDFAELPKYIQDIVEHPNDYLKVIGMFNE